MHGALSIGRKPSSPNEGNPTMQCVDLYRFNRRAIFLTGLVCVFLFVLYQNSMPANLWPDSRPPMNRSRTEVSYFEKVQDKGRKFVDQVQEKRKSTWHPREDGAEEIEAPGMQRKKTFQELTTGYNLSRSAYHEMYERRLLPLINAHKQVRDQPIRLLQLGLDCGSPFGPRTSYDAWKEYLPKDTEIYFIELDRKCAQDLIISVRKGVKTPYRKVREPSFTSKYEDPVLMREVDDDIPETMTDELEIKEAKIRKRLTRRAIKRKQKEAQRWKISATPPLEGRKGDSSWKLFSKNEEKNGKCTVYMGDQANTSFLRNVIFDASHSHDGFDLIIDAGLSVVSSQLISFKALFEQALVGGGIYFIEHMENSYNPVYGGEDWEEKKEVRTTVGLMKDLMEDLSANNARLGRRPKHAISRDVAEVECLEGICAIAKTQAQAEDDVEPDKE